MMLVEEVIERRRTMVDLRTGPEQAPVRPSLDLARCILSAFPELEAATKKQP